MDFLAASLQEELGCAAADARRVAELARERRATFGGSLEDDDEDLFLRLRDPRGFGAFSSGLLDDPVLSEETRTAIAERVFDLLVIPAGEHEVFALETRAPRNLLRFASHLIRANAFTPLHLLHLVYSVFVDRGLATGVERPLRSLVLARVAESASLDDRPSALYVSLHLSSLPESEATEELRGIFASRTVPWPFKRLLARIVTPDVSGIAAWVQLAQAEGLLPLDLDPQDPSIHANLPRIHESFGPLLAVVGPSFAPAAPGPPSHESSSP